MQIKSMELVLFDNNNAPIVVTTANSSANFKKHTRSIHVRVSKYEFEFKLADVLTIQQVSTETKTSLSKTMMRSLRSGYAGSLLGMDGTRSALFDLTVRGSVKVTIGKYEAYWPDHSVFIIELTEKDIELFGPMLENANRDQARLSSFEEDLTKLERMTIDGERALAELIHEIGDLKEALESHQKQIDDCKTFDDREKNRSITKQKHMELQRKINIGRALAYRFSKQVTPTLSDVTDGGGARLVSYPKKTDLPTPSTVAAVPNSLEMGDRPKTLDAKNLIWLFVIIATIVGAVRRCSEEEPARPASETQKSEPSNTYSAAPNSGVLKSDSKSTKENLRPTPEYEGGAEKIDTSSFKTEVVAEGPSFPCVNLSIVTEKIVCASADLSKMDRDLSRAFKLKVKGYSGEERQATLAEQRSNLLNRNSCSDSDCVFEWYKTNSAWVASLP